MGVDAPDRELPVTYDAVPLGGSGGEDRLAGKVNERVGLETGDVVPGRTEDKTRRKTWDTFDKTVPVAGPVLVGEGGLEEYGVPEPPILLSSRPYASNKTCGFSRLNDRRLNRRIVVRTRCRNRYTINTNMQHNAK